MPVKIDKRVVERSFSRAADSYDSYSDIQKYSARKLTRLIPAASITPAVLDVGTGTGEILGLLSKQISVTSLIAIDISLPMLEQARRKAFTSFPEFVAGDLHSLPFHDRRFDLITSGLTYQWATDLDGAFSEALRVLRPGGHFLLTVMSDGSLKELGESFRAVSNVIELMEFVSLTSLKNVASATGFEVKYASSEIIEREYKDLFELLRTLRGTGASMHHTGGDSGLGRGLRVKAAAPIYKERFPVKDGSGIRATYNIAYLLLMKPTEL